MISLPSFSMKETTVAPTIKESVNDDTRDFWKVQVFEQINGGQIQIFIWRGCLPRVQVWWFAFDALFVTNIRLTIDILLIPFHSCRPKDVFRFEKNVSASISAATNSNGVNTNTWKTSITFITVKTIKKWREESDAKSQRKFEFRLLLCKIE